MGRVKLKIKKLEKNTGRQSTYSKRKNGLLKKANELSILCDIDIVLLMFSPSGKPAIYKGGNSSIEQVVDKFSQLTQQERAKRKLENLEALKKTYRKSDHEVNIQDFLGPCSYQSVEDLTAQANLLRTQISIVQKKLSYWMNLDMIDTLENLGQTEVSLLESLDQIRRHKLTLGKQQQMEIQCANQFQDGMYVPCNLGIEEQLQPLSWILNDHNHHRVVFKELNVPRPKDSEGSAGTSLGSYSDFFGASEKVGITKIGQENGILNKFSITDSSSLQLNEQQSLQVHEQHAYPSYNNGLLCDKNFQSTAQMNVQDNTSGYCVDRKYDVPQSGYDPTDHSWASTPGICVAPMFDENLYPQQHYSFYDHVAKDLDRMYGNDGHHSGLRN